MLIQINGPSRLGVTPIIRNPSFVYTRKQIGLSGNPTAIGIKIQMLEETIKADEKKTHYWEKDQNPNVRQCPAADNNSIPSISPKHPQWLLLRHTRSLSFIPSPSKPGLPSPSSVYIHNRTFSVKPVQGLIQERHLRCDCLISPIQTVLFSFVLAVIHNCNPPQLSINIACRDSSIVRFSPTNRCS